MKSEHSVIDVYQKLNSFSDKWNPKIITSLNGQDVKLAKLEGEFVWHSHEDEDELFIVLSGRLQMQFRDRTEIIEEGQMIMVPKGVNRRPLNIRVTLCTILQWTNLIESSPGSN